jgi:predicted nuclease with RNAse H fold
VSRLYLGYDPGGGGAHGVAAIDGGDVVCDTLVTAQSAIDWFRERCREREGVALGVDTLTLWSSGPAGWRPADRALRAVYVDVANSVTAPNSLYGAMPINGAVVMRALSESVQGLRVTETHPKVLYFALTGHLYNYEQQAAAMVQNLSRWIGLGDVDVNSEHAWDALVSAYAARQWVSNDWPTDLHLLPQNADEELVPVFGNQSHYVWPIPIELAGVPLTHETTAPSPRGRDRWRVAVERLQQVGHDDVAQQIEDYRNSRNERSGWDAWLKSNFPALWAIYETGD